MTHVGGERICNYDVATHYPLKFYVCTLSKFGLHNSNLYTHVRTWYHAFVCSMHFRIPSSSRNVATHLA